VVEGSNLKVYGLRLGGCRYGFMVRVLVVVLWFVVKGFLCFVVVGKGTISLLRFKSNSVNELFKHCRASNPHTMRKICLALVRHRHM